MRLVLKYVLFLAVLVLFPTSTRAQPYPSRQDSVGTPSAPAAPRLRFQHLTNEDGLSMNLVRAMLQDRQGFMWFGTEDGLNRYDGYRFTVFKAVPFDSTSLLDDNIYALAEDATGVLWVGTSAGLSRLDPHTGRFYHYRHDPRDPSSLSTNVVYALHERACEPGVLFFIAPATTDVRGFADGGPVVAPNAPSPDARRFMEMQVAGLRQKILDLYAEDYGLALVGANLTENSGAAVADVLEALEEVAAQSGHPELVDAPLFLVGGMSSAGCGIYSFTRANSSRVIGFTSQKSDCLTLGNAGPAHLVPGYFFIGGADVPAYAATITAVFEANRREGAPWALAIEPGTGHVAVDAPDLFVHWIGAVLAGRLPETAVAGSPVELRALDEASGWLGNRETFSIAPYAQYDGDPREASWLPSRQTAEDWQAFVSRDAGD